MTDHPCKGMDRLAIEAFERIAINDQPGTSTKTLEKLQRRGVIERGPDKLCRDAFGTFTIPQWYVPLPVHAQWCEWCSEQPDQATQQ